MSEDFISPKKEQLIIKTTGKRDSELGLRFIDIEKQSTRGFLIKETIKLEGQNEFLFVLERKIK